MVPPAVPSQSPARQSPESAVHIFSLMAGFLASPPCPCTIFLGLAADELAGPRFRWHAIINKRDWVLLTDDDDIRSVFVACPPTCCTSQLKSLMVPRNLSRRPKLKLPKCLGEKYAKSHAHEYQSWRNWTLLHGLQEGDAGAGGFDWLRGEKPPAGWSHGRRLQPPRLFFGGRREEKKG